MSRPGKKALWTDRTPRRRKDADAASPPDLLTKDQKVAIVESLARARGARGFDTDEAAVAIGFAGWAAAAAAFLDAVLDGDLELDVQDGDVVFISPGGQKRTLADNDKWWRRQ